MLSSGYAKYILDKYIKYKYEQRNVFYNIQEEEEDDLPIFIVPETDALDSIMKKFVYRVGDKYQKQTCLIPKNFHKLIDELNATTLKTLNDNIYKLS